MKFSFYIVFNKISIPFACDSNLVFLRRMHLASRDVLMSYGDILVLDSLRFHIIIKMFVMRNTTGNSISLDSPGRSRWRRPWSLTSGRRCWMQFSSFWPTSWLYLQYIKAWVRSSATPSSHSVQEGDTVGVIWCILSLVTTSLWSNLKLKDVRSLPSPGSLLILQIWSHSEVGDRSSALQGLYLAWSMGSLVRYVSVRAEVHCLIDMVVMSDWPLSFIVLMES